MVLFLLLLTVSGCKHSFIPTRMCKELYLQRAGEPSYTIVVNHMECTECLDAFILSEVLQTPKDLVGTLGDSINRDILLCGEFPSRLVDQNSLRFNSKSSFELTGKIVGYDTTNKKWQYAPIFYVESYRLFKRNHFGD